MGLIKVFILGSCVSRDPFELAAQDDFKIVDYFARSSFASLGAKPYVDEEILEKIESSFQQRVVRADMEKTVFSRLLESDYDFLLIDLVDERFSIALRGESIHTFSSEYKKALYRPNSYRLVRPDAPEWMDYWRIGLKKLANFLKFNELDQKVLINKIYWTFEGDYSGFLNKKYGPDYRNRVNESLNLMYEELRLALPKSRFICYAENDLRVDISHKWGLAPFHFNKTVQLKQLVSLKKISADLKCEKDALPYFEDELGRRMYYKYTPAKNQSASPLLVILHGHGFAANPSKYENPNLNVLAPIDNFGVDQCGSWWLGENGDFFVKDLLHALVEKKLKNTSGQLYFWGSSMGGFGALLHGILMEANAVYANIPQVKLLGSTYSDRGMKKYFSPIFGDAPSGLYNDLANLLESQLSANVLSKPPLFFIAQSRFDYENYLEEQSLYFFKRCLKLNVNIHYEVFPKKGHALMMPLNQSVEKMMAYPTDIHNKNDAAKKSVTNFSGKFDDVDIKNIILAPNGKKLIDFLKQDAVYVSLIRMALLKGVIKIPSLFSDRLAVCKSSVYVGINCLYFEEEGSDKPFYLVQDNGRAFPYAVYSPKDHVGFVMGNPPPRYVKLFNKLKTRKPIKGAFNGLLNFYARPYHYFVDRIQFVFDDGLKNLSFDVYSAKNCAYIDFGSGLIPGVKQTVLPDSETFVKRVNSGGIYIDPQRSFSKSYNQSLYEKFMAALDEKNKDLIPSGVKTEIQALPVLWLGLSAEKRRYLECEDLYRRIIEAMEARFDRYFIIFDGLTSGLGGDKKAVREASVFEFSVLRNLKREVCKGEVIDLIGACAEEKIEYARYVDFFIANFLTDSIWLSFFHKKKGIGFGANGAKPLFDNTGMIIADPGKVKNVLDGETNLSKVSFSIDPSYLYEIFESNFMRNFSNKNSVAHND